MLIEVKEPEGCLVQPVETVVLSGCLQTGGVFSRRCKDLLQTPP